MSRSLAFILIVGSSCVTEPKFPQKKAPEIDAKALEEALSETIAPEPENSPRPGDRILYFPDGRQSRFFTIRAGRGEYYRNLVQRYCYLPEGAVELIPKADIESVRDPRGPSTATNASLEVSDWLVVTGSEAEVLRVEQFLNLYYASVPQIEIEAKIAEVTSDNSRDFGASTSIFNKVRSKIVEDVDSSAEGIQNPDPNFHSILSQMHTSFPTSNTDVQGDFLFRAIVKHTEIKSTLKLLMASRNIDIVSSPRIAVRNGGKAEIINGEEIPFVNITNFNPNQTSFSGSVSFRQTGVKLYIIPYLAGTDTIMLNVEAEVSTPSGFTTVGGVQNPIIVTRNAKTDVHIREGSTFVIGGLISSNDSEFVKKVPLLGDIPLLGFFFRSTFTQKIYTEVIFFITPRVIYPEARAGDLLKL